MISLFALVFLSGIMFFLGMAVGWDMGEREAERRWSDIVAKGEYDRKYGHQ